MSTAARLPLPRPFGRWSVVFRDSAGRLAELTIVLTSPHRWDVAAVGDPDRWVVLRRGPVAIGLRLTLD